VKHVQSAVIKRPRDDRGKCSTSANISLSPTLRKHSTHQK